MIESNRLFILRSTFSWNPIARSLCSQSNGGAYSKPTGDGWASISATPLFLKPISTGFPRSHFQYSHHNKGLRVRERTLGLTASGNSILSYQQLGIDSMKEESNLDEYVYSALRLATPGLTSWTTGSSIGCLGTVEVVRLLNTESITGTVLAEIPERKLQPIHCTLLSTK